MSVTPGSLWIRSGPLLEPRERTISGGHGGGETPVPIPNTAVKPVSADGTWGVAPWESRTPPGFLRTKPPAHAGGFVVSGLRRRVRGSNSGLVKQPKGLPAKIDPLTTLLSHGPSNTVWFSAPAWHWGFRQPRAGFETGPPFGQQSEWSSPGERRSRSGGSRRPGQPARQHRSQHWSGSTDRTAWPIGGTAFGCERAARTSTERFGKTIERIRSSSGADAARR